MTPLPELIRRSDFLIENARFTTLATHGPDGPWASTVNYVPLRGPLQLLWYSLRRARHSRNIEADPRVSGSIYLTGLPGLGLDGAQFTATARPVEPEELDALSSWYYERNFPDEEVRRQWRLPLEEFRDEGHRRFYLLEIQRWWLLDIDQWLVDKNDQRVPVPLDAITGLPTPATDSSAGAR
ncbi:pyridoxamine 5'-phosphate oxidase family protein [Streptomyces sp. NPDC059092]|uniref:pyridoxamine 5'-phosphate oxidase family protein n=1 Tax=Streptomyces sp. NPDC059092 TaxID=3346725 RepID=UPI0036BBBF5B